MITVGIFGVSIVASAAVAQYQIHAQGVRLDEIEVQQKTDHDTLTRIRVDVSWIRKALEKGRVRVGRKPYLRRTVYRTRRCAQGTDC